MASKKHLVLDDDVYEALRDRKLLLGSHLGSLGNSILRNSIAHIHISDAICKSLLESGRISTAEYEEAVKEATRTVQSVRIPRKPPIETLPSGRVVSGSWEIETLSNSPTGSFGILEGWARDSLSRPMGLHTHDADEYLIVISGTTVITMTGLPFTLTKGATLMVPARILHTATPLTNDCHILAITIPATDDFLPERTFTTRQC
jgi:mannose-6-phosphate isomerase-like protein (cupin superfamily)